MKSNYPNQIDTSAELPVVRDGITEISSEILNSLRSAIIQIEKTLGINPQGASGNTVSSRVSASLDQSGNLLREALERANVIFGQITDDNIAANGAISESKLKLNVPTQVLQSEVSQISSLIDGLILKLDEVAALLNIHVSPIATGRHKAKAITVDSIDETSSDTATTSIIGANLQSIIETIYSSHINLSAFATEINRSHLSHQIYFDNTKISDITSSENLQEVVEDIAYINSEALKDSFSYLNSNGIVNFGKKTSKYEQLNRNDEIIPPMGVAFSPSSISYTNVIFSSPITPAFEINQFDILILSDTTDLVDDSEYFIKSVYLDGTGKVLSVDIFTSLKTSSTGFVSASIYKNAYDYNNKNGLNSTVKPRYLYTNTPEVSICHPNSATIISTGLDYTKISETNSQFNIVADDELEITVDVYDTTLDYNEQTVDSIVYRINLEFSNKNFPALAYKLRVLSSYEIAISHIIPDLSSDNKKRSLKLLNADEYIAIDTLGFTENLNKTYYGKYGNPLHINGVLQKDLYSVIPFTNSQVRLNSGTQRISIIGSSFDSYGIEVGDTAYISSPENAADAFCSRISAVEAGYIELDNPTISFVGNLTSESIVFVIKNTVKVSDLNFEIVSDANGYMIIDALFDKFARLFYNKRAEVSQFIQNGGLFATVVDISEGYLPTEEIILTINAQGEAFLTNLSGDEGLRTLIHSNGEYLVRSPENDGYITVKVSYLSQPTSSISCSIFAYAEHSYDIFHLSRFIFGPTLGRIFGFSGTPGIPNIIDKRTFGTTSTKQISPKFIEKYIEQPRHDLRGTGIISGCQVFNIIDGNDFADFKKFDISGGVAIVNGIRFTINPISEIKIYPTQDFYVAINKVGSIEILQPDSLGNAPTSKSDLNYALLAIIRYDGTVMTSILNDEDSFDLRFFIDRIDYKLSKEIIVSTDQSEGHFTDIASAVRYARFYNKIYKTNGVRSTSGPTIRVREGIFEINEPILINMDMQFIGSGPGTIIRRAAEFTGGQYIVFKNLDPNSVPFIIGGGIGENSNLIVRGTLFKDFVYETGDDYTGVSSLFVITQSLGTSSSFFEKPPLFKFEGIQAYGPGISLSVPIKFEHFIVFTQTDALRTKPNNIAFGNVIVTGCYFDALGDEASIVYAYVDDNDAGNKSTVKNVVCVGNIADNLSPGDTTGKIIFDSYIETIMINLIEESNAINY